MKNRPSACVTASYVVPDGSWTAAIVAPGISAPWASLTTPVIEAVVTPCAAAGVANTPSASNAATAHTHPDRIEEVIANSTLNTGYRKRAILARPGNLFETKKPPGQRRERPAASD